MKMLSKFSLMQTHNKLHNSEYSAHIILQYIQDFKTKYMLNLTLSDKTSTMLLRL